MSLVPRFNFCSAPLQPCVAERSLVGGLLLACCLRPALVSADMVVRSRRSSALAAAARMLRVVAAKTPALW
jgi:hypothetical protein